MPDYDHFLLKDDTPKINTVHTILKGEDAEWLKRECNRFTRQLGYKLKELFSEFFEKYCDPSKKPEENLRAICSKNVRNLKQQCWVR